MTEYPNWFDSVARANFTEFLLPEAGRDNYQALQIGAFVGHASDWLCRYVLTGDKSILHDVDTWQGSDEAEHGLFDWDDVFDTYLDRIGLRAYMKVRYFRMTSDKFFESYKEMLDIGNQFDFVYIDGDHTADQVWKDGAKGWKYLKQGGILAFDDYGWDAGKGPAYNPKHGIDTFLEVHDGEYELLAKNWQVWIRKL
jgi:hypothetical protein